MFSAATFGPDLAVDVLQMKIRDSRVVLSHEGDRIAAGIGVVAGVEKK
jgi:hypothetical protein